MKQYPRVLIVDGESYYKKNATGITKRSLFGDWPSSRIMEFHLVKPGSIESESHNVRDFLIPPQVFPINMAIRKRLDLPLAMEGKGLDDTSAVNPTSYKTKISWKKSIICFGKYIAESYCINIKPIVSILEMEGFVPDVIYTMGNNFAVMNLVNKLSSYFDCRTCLHYMDNWRESAFQDTIPIFGLNRKYNKAAKKVEERSKCSLVISKKMQVVYSEKYQHDYIALMNSIYLNMRNMDQVNNNKTHLISFVYAGGLHLDRYKGLLAIENEINSFSSQARLVIYTSDYDREQYGKLFNSRLTEFRNFLPHNEVHQIYEAADVLVHIESFDAARKCYTKYSLSTKIPEYMSYGKPILFYGPDDIAVCEYIKEVNAGLCANSKEMLNSAIQQLIEDASLRKKTGLNGLQCAKSNHDIYNARKTLCNVLSGS